MATVSNVVGSPMHCLYRSLGDYSCGGICRLDLIQVVPWDADSSNENQSDGLDCIDMVMLDNIWGWSDDGGRQYYMMILGKCYPAVQWQICEEAIPCWYISETFPNLTYWKQNWRWVESWNWIRYCFSCIVLLTIHCFVKIVFNVEYLLLEIEKGHLIGRSVVLIDSFL